MAGSKIARPLFWMNKGGERAVGTRPARSHRLKKEGQTRGVNRAEGAAPSTDTHAVLAETCGKGSGRHTVVHWVPPRELWLAAQKAALGVFINRA